MSNPLTAPQRVDFSVIPGTSGIIGSPSGIHMAMTSQTPVLDWGMFEFYCELYGRKIGALSEQTELRIDVLFTITADENAALTSGNREIFDIVWVRSGVRESIVRGLLTVDMPVAEERSDG